MLIHQYMAYSFYNLNELDSARVHFLTLLSLDNTTELDPISTSPKIIDFFDGIQQEFKQLGKNARLVPVKEYIFVKDARPAAAWRSLILPGWGQYYKNQHRRGLCGRAHLNCHRLVGRKEVQGPVFKRTESCQHSRSLRQV